MLRDAKVFSPFCGVYYHALVDWGFALMTQGGPLWQRAGAQGIAKIKGIAKTKRDGSSGFGVLGPPINVWQNEDNSSLYMGDQSGSAFQPDATVACFIASDPPLGERTESPSCRVPSRRRFCALRR